MDRERVELEADIEKLHHTLEEDRSQFQYDYIVDSDDDDSEDEDDVLFIDMEKQETTAASVVSVSVQSSDGRSPSSAQSVTSQPTTATESLDQEDEEEGGELFREVGVMQEELNSSSTPLPATLESCLVLNRAYQDVVSDLITRIELELAENREAQRHLEEDAKESNLNQISKKRFPYTATQPYFKMKFGSTPSQNEDTHLKHLTEEPDLDKRPERIWHGRQKQLLKEAVKVDALEKLLQPLLSRRELEEDKLNTVGEGTEGWHQIHSRITTIDQEIEEKKKIPGDVLLQNVDPEKVDWMKISNMTFEGKRDWLACRRAWEHSINPHLNQRDMTEAEEQRLLELIRETNKSDWAYIAQQLGTGRTPFQVLQYYQQNLSNEMLDRPWRREEDEQLIRVVEKCQHYHFNWRKVSHYMEGRSGMQCYKRYSKLDPNINKGHWTEAEDAQLMTAVQLMGTHNWGRVKELVPGRTREQCRERYANSLDPSISGKPWTYEEDKKLLKSVALHGKGNWVKCCRELPGRTDNQALQRYRRLEDWRRKTEWFTKQSEQDRDLLQGNNLPVDQRSQAQQKNWEQFKNKFGVLPDDYVKQRQDMDKGDVVVPRPPFMIGLANKSGGKVWERRIRLHKLIESHIDKLKEKFNFIRPSVAGVFELREAISQLSQDCLSQRDQLMNKRKDQLGQLIHGLPSVISVKELLAVSRGGKIPEKKKRGPLPRKKKGGTLPPRLMKSMKIDTELRMVVRANLKDRSLKRGRPRRFFWDITGDQVLTDEEILELKSTAFSLYLKSLGADHTELLKSGRRAYPQLFHTLQQQQLQSSTFTPQPASPSTSSPSSSPSTSTSTLAQKPVRRSERRSKKSQAESDDPAISDPFTLLGLPLNSMGFTEWQRRRDYEMLERLSAREQGDRVHDQLSEGVSCAVPAAAAMEVSTGDSSMPRPSSGSVIGQGMSLVHDRIQQALEEQAARERQTSGRSAPSDGGVASDAGGEGQGSDSRGAPSGGGGEASTTATSVGARRLPSTASAQPDAQQAAPASPSLSQGAGTPSTPVFRHPLAPVGGSGGGPPSLPNLPPTLNTMQSFKSLLLRRLGLIKKAGNLYHLPSYLAKKDQQMATLIQLGAKVKELNRGTIDLSRMMNRVSQETNFSHPGKRRSKLREELTQQQQQQQQAADDSKQFDHKVLETIRKTPEFQSLRSRFLAVFSWPALLSAIYPPFQRKDYVDKAGGQSHLKPVGEEDLPTFQTLRKRPPLLKSKAFYRYANKTKLEKEALVRQKEQKRILRQVQMLMADEDDPTPHVTYDPDSDDNATSQPGASKPHSRGRDDDDIELPAPKRKRRCRYRRRDPTQKAVRQSTRVTEKKTYVDSINVKRLVGPRKRRGERGVGPPRVAKIRPDRLHPSVRMAMIDAIVENRDRAPRKHGTVVGQWNPGGYVSDEDDGQMETELQRGGDWMGDLPSEQRDSLALLERESIVDDTGENGGGSTSAASTSTGASRTRFPASSGPAGSASTTSTAGTSSSPHPGTSSRHRGTFSPHRGTFSPHPDTSSPHPSTSAHLPEHSGPVRDLTSPTHDAVDPPARSSGNKAPSAVVHSRSVSFLGKSTLASSSRAAAQSDSHVTGHSQSAVSSHRQIPEVVLLESDDDDDDDDDDGGGGPSVASLLAAKRARQ